MKFLLILAAFAAGPCEAGIVTNGALTTGGQGVVGGTATVQGNAFSVGGSTLVASGGKVGVGTASPSSTFTVQGLSLFSGTVTFSPGLHKSTEVVSTNSLSFSASTYTCLAGTTLNLKTTGGDVAVFFSGAVSNGTMNADTLLGFYQGDPAGDILMGILDWTVVTANYAFPAAFYKVMKNVPTGDRWWCLAGKTSGATTGTITGDSASSNYRKWSFGVMELK